MRTLLTQLIFLAGLLFNSQAVQSLEPFNHQYKSTFAGFSAKSYRDLKQLEDGTWELSMVSKNLFAKYQEISHFRLDESGYPVPIENRFEGRLFGAKRKEVTRFDWQAGIATWTRKDDVREVQLEPGTLDRILYQLLVPLDAAKGTEVATYRFVNRGSLRTYQFERVGTEKATIDHREMETVKMRRMDSKKQKETTLWLAPDMDYELVKIQHHDEDGADYKMELKLK